MEMEFSFDIKIEDWSVIQNDMTVLQIDQWFFFYLRKSDDQSKYYIDHNQNNGLGKHDEILISNPISVSNNWKKEFLERFLKTQSFFENIDKFLFEFFKISRNLSRL